VVSRTRLYMSLQNSTDHCDIYTPPGPVPYTEVEVVEQRDRPYFHGWMWWQERELTKFRLPDVLK
jgi:hypothetical protein